MQLVWSLTEFSIVIVFQFFSAFLLKAIRKQTSLWNKNCITFMRVIGRRLVSSVDVLILLNSSMWIVDDSSLLCIISLLLKMVFWPYEHTSKQFILARLFSMRKRIYSSILRSLMDWFMMKISIGSILRSYDSTLKEITQWTICTLVADAIELEGFPRIIKHLLREPPLEDRPIVESKVGVVSMWKKDSISCHVQLIKWSRFYRI